jgi:hypothetical protein
MDKPATAGQAQVFIILGVWMNAGFQGPVRIVKKHRVGRIIHRDSQLNFYNFPSRFIRARAVVAFRVFVSRLFLFRMVVVEINDLSTWPISKKCTKFSRYLQVVL